MKGRQSYDHALLLETVRGRATEIRMSLAFLAAHAIAFGALNLISGITLSPVYMILSSCLVASVTITSSVIAHRPPRDGARRTAHQILLSLNLLIYPVILVIRAHACPECQQAPSPLGYIYISVAAYLGLQIFQLDVTVFGIMLCLSFLVVLVRQVLVSRQGWEILQAAIVALSVSASLFTTLKTRRDVHDRLTLTNENSKLLSDVQSTLYDILHERQVLLVAFNHLSEVSRQHVAAASMLLSVREDDTARRVGNALWALQQTLENVLCLTTNARDEPGVTSARDIMDAITGRLSLLLKLTGRRLSRIDGYNLGTALVDMDHKALEVMLALIFSSSLQWADTDTATPFDVSLTCQIDGGFFRARLMLADPLCSFIRRDRVLFQRLQSLCNGVSTAERLGALEIEMIIACTVTGRCEPHPSPEPVEAMGGAVHESTPVRDVLFLRGRGLLDEALCILLEETGGAIHSVYSVNEAVAQVHLVQRPWRSLVVSVDQVGWEAVRDIAHSGATIRILAVTLTGGSESSPGTPVLSLPCTLSDLLNAL